MNNFKHFILIYFYFLLVFCQSCATKTAKVEPSKIRGAMAPDQIRIILEENSQTLAICYKTELKKSKRKFSNIIESKFNINQSGKVENLTLRVLKGEENSNILDCLSKSLKTIQFPKPSGNGAVSVTQPFNFYPNQP